MIKFYKVRKVKTPERGTKLSSWIDFFIPDDLDEIREDIKYTPTEKITNQDFCKEKWLANGDIFIPHGMWVLIPTWLKVVMEQLEWQWAIEMVMYNKSGIAVKNNLVVWACVIDNDYRGEVNLHLINCSRENITLKCGQKVAQWVVRIVLLEDIIEINEEEFVEYQETERGEGGFWSTGK